MKVVILAGGKGSRISEITKNIPKPMIMVNNKPIIEHIINIYASQNFKEFLIATGYKGNLITKYFKRFEIRKNYFKLRSLEKIVKISFVDTGKKTMTGGRLKLLKRYFGKHDTNFMFTYGDGLANVDLNKLQKFHMKKKKIATLTAVRPISRYGVLDIKGTFVKTFEEKKPLKTGWINGGFFVFNLKIFNHIKNTMTILEREPLEKLAKLKNLVALKHHGFWHSIDTSRDKDYLENILKKSKKLPWMKK
tara:strand:- start:1387 stop:2133 length:747 start_codon:yes stop_codon:yes gene_type:complete